MKQSYEPLFSILIANYNNGQYLEECIQSVLNQSYTNWEIILVDDGSTDSSHDIYKNYQKNDKIKIYFNKINKGTGYTKRKCVELANGDICGFLDPDDSLVYNAMEIMVEKHRNYPKHSIIYSTNYICDEYLNVREISKYTKEIPPEHSNLTYPGISHFATFKKYLYDKTPGICPTIKRAVDQDLYLKLEEQGPVKFINIPLYYYRYHVKGISTTNNLYKAHYWHLLISIKTRKRRIKEKSNVPNISKNKLYERALNYYHARMIEKAKKKELLKVTFLFFKSLRYIIYDKKLLSLRILLNTLLKKY